MVRFENAIQKKVRLIDVFFVAVSLAASVQVLLDGAHLTGDFAAPFEATVTVDARLRGARLVAAAAAQQIAAVDARRRAVALASGRTQRTRRPVRRAVIRRLFGVNQVLAARRLDARLFGYNRLAVVTFLKGSGIIKKLLQIRVLFERLTWYDFGGAVELLLEPGGHVAEQRQLAPAGAQRARAGQSVTLALGAHKVLDGQAPGLVVVQHHLRLEVAPLAIARVHELARLLVAVLHVVRAAAPLPIAAR